MTAELLDIFAEAMQPEQELSTALDKLQVSSSNPDVHLSWNFRCSKVCALGSIGCASVRLAMRMWNSLPFEIHEYRVRPDTLHLF